MVSESTNIIMSRMDFLDFEPNEPGFVEDICMYARCQMFEQMKALVERQKRRSISFRLSRSRKKRFLVGVSSALIVANYYEDFQMMEYLLSLGADPRRHHALDGHTALHSCLSTKDQSLLLRHGASPLAKDVYRKTPLFYARRTEKNRGQTIVEFEFTQAMAGRPFDATMSLKVLQSQHNDGFPPRGQGAYLKSWETTPIAVPQLQEDGDMTTDCARMEPDLSEFQNFLASALLDTIADSQLEQMRFLIMGYLTPIDLLNGWDAYIE